MLFLHICQINSVPFVAGIRTRDDASDVERHQLFTLNVRCQVTHLIILDF